MMNDRFDAQLRAHLLSSADTKPGDGQLATVLQSVAGTAQRHPVAARLTWFPGRVGPIPTRALRFGLVAAALVGAMVAAALYVGSPGRSTVFEGTWLATDPGDGSAMSLVVGAGRTPTVHFVDHESTDGACVDDAVKVFTADGTGTITGDRLEAAWPDGGGCGLRTVSMAPGTYTHEERTDTLLDGQGLRWARVEDAPPTRGPVTEPTAGPSAGPSPSPRRASSSDCVVVEPGEAYGARVGSLFVTLTAPLDPSIAWEGTKEGFELSGSCRSGGPVDVRINAVTTVYADACDPSSGVAVGSYAEAVEQLDAQRGPMRIELPPHSATVGGYRSAWFHLGFDGAPCEGLQLWNGVDISDGDVLAYLLDVGGTTLGIALWFRGNAAPTGDQRDTAESMIYGIRIESGLAPGATDPVAIPECMQFDREGTYTRTLGGLPVSLTVPGTQSEPWSGARDEWNLRKASCGGAGMPSISATLVSDVYRDACRWEAAYVATPTAADVVTALRAQTGHPTSAPVQMTLGGYAATRLDVSAPAGSFDGQTCDDGGEGIPYAHLYDDQVIVAGTVQQVYVVDIDVDGQVLVLNASYFPDETPAVVIEAIDSILATLRVGS